MFQGWLKEEGVVGPFPLFGDEDISLKARVSGNAASLGLSPSDFHSSIAAFLPPAPRSVSSTTDPWGHTGVSMDTHRTLDKGSPTQAAAFTPHSDGQLQQDPCFVSNYGGH